LSLIARRAFAHPPLVLQEETIYPHPLAKSDAKLSETFFCRTCFAERFRVGDWCARTFALPSLESWLTSVLRNSKKCKQAVLTDAPFTKHGANVWHDVRSLD